ncbi:MAG: hypothetical protein AAGI38_03755 [Bacteroidota bacterium]
MEISITSLPLWVNLAFAVSFPVAPYLIGRAAKTGYLKAGASNASAQQLQRAIWIFYGAYFLVVGGISLTGFFAENTLPPRILIFTALPLLVFYFGYVLRSNWFQKVLTHIPLASMVFIHVFRFIGIFFLISLMYDALPATFAIAGGVGDILAASLGLWVVYALNKQKTYAIRLTYIWNVIGVLDILNVLATAVITTRLALATGGIGVAEFGTFPFCWIPAFAPATIIFLHVMVFKKLAMIRSLNQPISQLAQV